ncbi:PREDICTED: uncharacterized protein LOC106308578 [Brassica oleracea var. oleracea]|uniref:uncharacterized protein LOC106308578 n=1 Tax=Brassica oleracea var. oleracea TaxID=109376 RepID=UPI0006A6F8FD|nr:PREDICTED: uncharacterized protein LOC106308578 [Brassica oleracea var. oleracea]
MEVYIDDMLVKSLHASDHVSHLEEGLARLNSHNMKLNSAKCRFAIASGEFLGYMVTYRGIEDNPKQIDALIRMASPKNKRESEPVRRRLAKWAVELSEYGIEYRPRTSAKSQVLADVLVQLPTRTVTNKEPNSTWVLHVDGSSFKQVSGIEIRLTSPTREILEQSFRLEFHESNNEAEYEAFIAELRLADGLKIRNIHAYCDSQLVASQYSGEYEARDERMDAYLKLVQNLA